MLVSAEFKYQRGLPSRLADWCFGPYTPLTLTSGRKPRAVWPGSHLLWNQPSQSLEGAVPQATSSREQTQTTISSSVPPVTPQPRVASISANISQDSCSLTMHSMDHTGSLRYTVHLALLLKLCVYQEKPRSVLPSWAPSASPGTSLALRNYCPFVGRKRNGMNKCLHFLLSADKH